MTHTAFAPGKLILMGEHAVVYGHPALAIAVDRGMTVTLTERQGPTGLDEATFTASYVVHDPALKHAAIIDSVLDFDQPSGRTSTRSADMIVEHVREQLSEDDEDTVIVSVGDDPLKVKKEYAKKGEEPPGPKFFSIHKAIPLDGVDGENSESAGVHAAPLCDDGRARFEGMGLVATVKVPKPPGIDPGQLPHKSSFS